MGKQGFTSDGRHMNFGHDESVPMPDGFNVPDNSTFCPQPFGRVIEEDGSIEAELYGTPESD